MKRELILVICCLIWSVSYSREIKGTVVDEARSGVPYSIVRVLDKRIAAMSDSMGEFALPTDKMELGDTLVISSFGYKTKLMSYSDYVEGKQDSIILTETPLSLPEVIARPKKIKKKTVGKQHKGGLLRAVLGDTPPIKGMCLGYEFHAKDNKRFALDKVGFYYTDREDRMTHMKFGIMIYDMSHVSSDPSRDFVSVLDRPIFFEYTYDPEDRGKYMFSVPENILLPKDGMVEIIFLENIKKGELLSYKSNLTGKSSWSRDLGEGYQYWMKQPFAFPFFVECIEVEE